MDYLFPSIGVLLILIVIWLNILASMAVYCDKTLTPFQRYSQWAIVWLFPLLGASFVLHLVYDHSPEAIPENWIPWPFKGLIFGKQIRRNKNRSESEFGDLPFNTTRHRTDSSGDGGGDGGD